MEREARMEAAKKKIRTCPVCGEKIGFTNMWFTKDRRGSVCRFVCLNCYHKLMEKGYDAELDRSIWPTHKTLDNVLKTIHEFHEYGALGVDVAISAGPPGSEEEKFSIVPATHVSGISVSKDMAQKVRQEILDEVAEMILTAVKAAEDGDQRKNIVSYATMMGHLTVLREVGYQVDTVYHACRGMYIPCMVRVSKVTIYNASELYK